MEELIKTNEYNLEQCILRNYNYILINNNYQIDTCTQKELFDSIAS